MSLLNTAFIPAPNCLITFHKPINAFLTGLITAFTIFLNVSDFYKQLQRSFLFLHATAIPTGPVNAVISPPIKGILVSSCAILGKTPLIPPLNRLKNLAPPLVALSNVIASEIPTILCANTPVATISGGIATPNKVNLAIAILVALLVPCKCSNSPVNLSAKNETIGATASPIVLAKLMKVF